MCGEKLNEIGGWNDALKKEDDDGDDDDKILLLYFYKKTRCKKQIKGVWLRKIFVSLPWLATSRMNRHLDKICNGIN